MEPLGDYLKRERESKNLPINKVVEDTHILKKFVIAIESDDFASFPGEAYLVGFLRSYSTYLGLDPGDVVRRYERIKLAETPTPMEQLIPKPRKNYGKLFLIIVLCLSFIVFIGGGGFYLVTNISFNSDNGLDNKAKSSSVVEDNKIKDDPKEDTKEKIVNDSLYVFDSEEATLNLKKGEVVQVQIEDKNYPITVKKVDPTVILTWGEDNNEMILIATFNNKIDVNNDSRYDIEAVLNTWDEKSANILFKRIEDAGFSGGRYSEYIDQSSIKTVLSNESKVNIDLNLIITEDTFLRYKVDENEEVERNVFRGNSIDISAKEQVVIWLANSGAVKINFDAFNKEIIPNELGIVDVKILNWKKEDGKYNLQMASLH